MSTESLLGQIIGNRQIEALLGEGGMGQVFRARHVNLGRLEALKVMRPSVSGNPRFQARFLQEARTVATLSHAHIVEIFECSQHGQLLFLSMEYLAGGSLRTLLRQRGSEPWPLDTCLKLIRQAAEALDFAHSHDVIHRDIKPDNLLLEQAGDPGGSTGYVLKIGDFGLAQIADSSGLTSSGMVLGTPHYMSPEQCQGLDLDGRSDIYALGVVLYELVTGYRPFQARSISEATRQHVSEPPPPPRLQRPDLPAAIEQLILRCLAKQPADRFGSAGELASELGQLIDALAAPAAPTPSAGVPLVRVFGGDGQLLRTLALGESGLTIGRLSSNDLALDDPGVSRNHLRLEWGSRRARATDLGSRSGTLLDGVPLAPQTPQPWAVGQALMVGPYTLRLELGAAPPARIGLALGAGQEALALTPGQPAIAQVTLSNHGTAADWLALSIEGLPSSWVQLPEHPLPLEPGTRMALALAVTPPSGQEARAGDYPITIRARSQTTPSESAVLRARWSVAALATGRLALQPAEARGRSQADYTLRLGNAGNVAARFALSASEPSGMLAFSFGQPEIELTPGQTIEQVLTVQAGRRLLGAAQRYPFTVRAVAGDLTCEAAGVFVRDAMVSF